MELRFPGASHRSKTKLLQHFQQVQPLPVRAEHPGTKGQDRHHAELPQQQGKGERLQVPGQGHHSHSQEAPGLQGDCDDEYLQIEGISIYISC